MVVECCNAEAARNFHASKDVRNQSRSKEAGRKQAKKLHSIKVLVLELEGKAMSNSVSNFKSVTTYVHIAEWILGNEGRRRTVEGKPSTWVDTMYKYLRHTQGKRKAKDTQAR